MKLHIVGRHMYLESRLPEIGGPAALSRGYGGSGRPQMPPKVSDRAKEVRRLRSMLLACLGAPPPPPPLLMRPARHPFS